MYQVIVLPKAKKALKKLKKPISSRIVATFDKLENDPRPSGCLKLTGEDNLWRIRVGDYRIIYSIEDNIRIVSITEIDHRKNIYQKK